MKNSSLNRVNLVYAFLMSAALFSRGFGGSMPIADQFLRFLPLGIYLILVMPVAAFGMNRFLNRSCAGKWPFAAAFLVIGLYTYLVLLGLVVLSDKPTQIGWQVLLVPLFPFGLLIWGWFVSIPVFIALWVSFGIFVRSLHWNRKGVL